jgi:hypothetical protein
VKATIYRSLVLLHPPDFQRHFGQEMELIFEECGRPPYLLLDIAISLGRQWLRRSGYLWLLLLAAVGGFVPFVLGFAFLNLSRNHFGLSYGYRVSQRFAVVSSASQPITKPLVIMTAVIAVMFISGTVTFAVTWFRYSQRRRV